MLRCFVLTTMSFFAPFAAWAEGPVPYTLGEGHTLRQVTQGPLHHFVGYYGITPWDATGRYLLCMQSDFSDRLVEPDDTASLMLVDLETGTPRKVGETRAWNFQQGALVHWLGSAPEREIIYNDRVDGALRSVILDVHSGEQRVMPEPIAAVANNGKHAASINYRRLRDTRPGYGYAGEADPFADQQHPEDDGLYLMDLESGEVKLLVSLDEVWQKEPVPEAYLGEKMWFNHVLFSRDDERIFFMARLHGDAGPRITAAFTIGVDGSDLRCVLPYDWGASHYDWVDGERLIVTTRYEGTPPWLHVLFTDGGDDYRPLAGEELTRDGHCHVSPDGRWMISDSYPQGAERMQSLYLMRLETEALEEVGQFHQPPQFTGEWRCDLHPRWSRDGSQVCIDSTHDGSRQVYIVDLNFPEP